MKRQILPHLRKVDQLKIARHKARFKVVACGRRWGKTTVGTAMAVYHVLESGHSVWWVAPIYGQSDMVWATLRRRLNQPGARILESKLRIELANGGSIEIKSGERPDLLRGVGLDFVVVDEAAFLPKYIWFDVLRPALSDRQGEALLISTPRGRNWFYNAYQMGQDPDKADWMSWSKPTIDNPLITEDELAEARRMMPEQSFRQEYEAHFIEGSGAVFRFIDRAATAPLEVEPIPGHRYIMGVDFGRYDDFTACVVIDQTEKQMVAIDRFNLIEWSLQRARIAALARKWKCELIMAEANSIGEPNIETLQREGLPVRSFQTTVRTKPQLIENLVAAIENGDLQIQPDAVLMGELATYSYRISRTGHTIYEAPPGLHDDSVIALALAWQQASIPPVTLAILEVW